MREKRVEFAGPRLMKANRSSTRPALSSSLGSAEGQGIVEYGLIIFMVGVAIIAILTMLGPGTGSIFSVITSNI